MVKDDQLLLHKISLKMALQEGIMTVEQYERKMEELDRIAKGKNNNNKDLVKATKNHLLQASL